MIPQAGLRKALLSFAAAALLLAGGCRTWSSREERAARSYNEGNVLRKEGRLDEAVDAYEEALDVQPDLAAATYNLALTLALLDRGDEAVVLLERLRRRDPENLKILRALAWTSEESGDAEAALGYYAAALDIFPADPGSLEGAARIHDAEGRPEEAVVLRKTLVRMDDDTGNILSLAWSLQSAGRHGESLSLCEDVLTEDPKDAEALRIASLAAEDMGLYREAAAYESRRIEAADGTDPGPWWRLARLDLTKLEEYEEGLEALAKALEFGFFDEPALEELRNSAPPSIRSGIENVVNARERP